MADPYATIDQADDSVQQAIAAAMEQPHTAESLPVCAFTYAVIMWLRQIASSRVL